MSSDSSSLHYTEYKYIQQQGNLILKCSLGSTQHHSVKIFTPNHAKKLVKQNGKTTEIFWAQFFWYRAYSANASSKLCKFICLQLSSLLLNFFSAVHCSGGGDQKTKLFRYLGVGLRAELRSWRIEKGAQLENSLSPLCTQWSLMASGSSGLNGVGWQMLFNSFFSWMDSSSPKKVNETAFSYGITQISNQD